MKVYKGKHTSFTVISNEIFKHGLSLKAIGLYAYIINKPDGWDFSINGTASQLNDGRDSVRSAVSELEKAGFLVRSQKRKTDGSFGDSVWWIYATPTTVDGKSDTPYSSRGVENPTTANPTTGKRLQVNTDKVNNKREREKLSLKEIEAIQKEYHITLSALQKVHAKYLGWCDAEGKHSSKKYFIYNWLPREEWDVNDLVGDGLLGKVGGLE